MLICGVADRAAGVPATIRLGGAGPVLYTFRWKRKRWSIWLLWGWL